MLKPTFKLFAQDTMDGVILQEKNVWQGKLKNKKLPKIKLENITILMILLVEPTTYLDSTTI